MAPQFINVQWDDLVGRFRDLDTGRFVSFDEGLANLNINFGRVRNNLGQYMDNWLYGGDVIRSSPFAKGDWTQVVRKIPTDLATFAPGPADRITGVVSWTADGVPQEDFSLSLGGGEVFSLKGWNDRLEGRIAGELRDISTWDEYTETIEITHVDFQVATLYPRGTPAAGEYQYWEGF